MTATISFDPVSLPPSAQAMRSRVRDFIQREVDAGTFEPGLGPGLNCHSPEFSRKCGAEGFIGMTWPKEYGGHQHSFLERYVVTEELLAVGAPVWAHWFADRQSGPVLLRYADDAIRRDVLPKIVSGECYFCIGMSEPDSGSDLASLKCRCEREGDEYIVNGQKIWTSIAMWSKMIILLVRTETDVEAKHDGITCLLVEMDSPGIEVRPIKNMGGGEMFAEVFFNDVRVPVENRLGAEGEGWKVTISALASERSSIAEVHGLIRKIEDVKNLAKKTIRGGRAMSENPGIRRRIAEADTKIEAMRLNGMRFLTKQLKGEPLGSETSINKLHRASLEIELGEIGIELMGNSANIRRGEATPGGGQWQTYCLNWPEVVIGGGTPNIQRNIIAERILGLPKD